MKPVHTYAGYLTFDLTQGAVHRLAQPDGSVKVVALFPSKWENVGRQSVAVANGETFNWMMYRVLEWDEVVLKVIPAASKPKNGA